MSLDKISNPQEPAKPATLHSVTPSVPPRSAAPRRHRRLPKPSREVAPPRSAAPCRHRRLPSRRRRWPGAAVPKPPGEEGGEGEGEKKGKSPPRAGRRVQAGDGGCRRVVAASSSSRSPRRRSRRTGGVPSSFLPRCDPIRLPPPPSIPSSGISSSFLFQILSMSMQ
jgi:hypothetical protein